MMMSPFSVISGASYWGMESSSNSIARISFSMESRANSRASAPGSERGGASDSLAWLPPVKATAERGIRAQTATTSTVVRKTLIDPVYHSVDRLA